VDEAKIAQFKKSLNTWEKLKEACGGNYTYSKRWSSWVGFGHTTDVVVENNKVVERRYKSFSGRPKLVAPGQPPAKPKGTSWTETGKELGSHKQGHPAKTLDELYKEAGEILDRPVPAVDDPSFGVNYDPSNAFLAGDDPIALLDSVLDRVVTMHASDRYLAEGTLDDLRREENVEGYAARLRHGEIGQGLNDYDAIFSRMSGKDFSGWISVEDGVDGMDQLARSVDFLRGKIAQHWA